TRSVRDTSTTKSTSRLSLDSSTTATATTILPTTSSIPATTTVLNNSTTTVLNNNNNKNKNNVSLIYAPFEPITPSLSDYCILNKQLTYDEKLAKLEAVHLSDIIYTIGDVKLTQHEINVLVKGLKFIPNRPFHLTNELRLCVQKFLQSSKLFKNIKIDNFLRSLFANRHQYQQNLSIEEQIALIQLQKRTDIIIRPADKNVGICIIENQVYESKVLQQLNDTNYYEMYNSNPCTQLYWRIKFVLNELLENNDITRFEIVKLKPVRPSSAVFYILPKLHKKSCPGRPIVSGCQHMTSNISKYLEQQLTPFIPLLQDIALEDYNIDNYIILKDTNHLLIEIDKLNHQINDQKLYVKYITLVSGDISALYTNIDQKDGLSELNDFVSNNSYRTNFSLTMNCFNKLLEVVLTGNVFIFKGVYFHQRMGTAMGTELATPYANIYVFKKEINALKLFVKKYSSSLILRFFRFLDDILCILFTTDKNIIEDLFNLLNQINNLKYTFESSTTKINFLDVNIIINKTLNRLETSLYVKPSNTFQYLQYTSSHPRYVIDNIPLSLSNRIVRLCSSPSTMWREFYNLFNRLLARGHRASNILQKILQIQQYNRKELIYRSKKQN
ncbi:unnamed protein product, partial [Didymodactylos carnosus]